MTNCAPELFFIKYRGISAPWEIVVDPKRVGYKCKKYSKWNDVLVDENSAEVLKAVGDSLLDSGEFPTEHYIDFARVWERVQRWAKDKEGLSLEPDLRPEFDRLARVMTLGAADAGMVDSVLQDAIKDISDIGVESRWQLFKQVALVELLRASKAAKTLLGADMPDPLSNGAGASSHAASVDSAVVRLYKGLGFIVTTETAGEGIDLMLDDLGLPTEASSQFRSTSTRVTGPPAVVIERKARSDLRLMEVVMVAGSLVIKLNDRHPAMKDGSTFQKYFDDQRLWRTFGLACRDQLGQLDETQSLLDAWGVHLAHEARRGAN